MQATPDIRQVLLVAALDDPQASELVMGLRVSGVNVLIANTIALASRADEFAVCIVILRPGQWRTTPAITTAIRCNPPYLIPVLTEPMFLPNAAWSTEVVNIKEAISETVHELEVLIKQRLQTVPNVVSRDLKQRRKNRLQHKATPFFRSILYHRNRIRINSMSKYLFIVLLLVISSGIALYYVKYGKNASPSTTVPLGGNFTSTSVFGQNYTVNVPGGCNGNDKTWWAVGTHFKTLGTPTATAANKNTPSKETPTPYVVEDNSTMTTCRQDGLYVQRTDNHYDYFSTAFFQGNGNETLPQHFSTQITASALNPSSAAIFTLGVRQQSNNEAGYDHGYGNDDLDVGVDGHWRTTRINDVTDQEDTTFTRGYVMPSSKVTLGAEVDGPRITFSINGQTVTTIVDTTYSDGYSIRFGLSDSNAKSAPSALYSNFSYKPLANSNLTKQAVVATATAQASENMHAPYTAVLPGFGCDRGPGQWEPVTKEHNYVTASCQLNGLAVSQDESAQYIGYVSFYGLDGNLPTNYNIKVQIDTSELNNGCAGLMTRTDTGAAGYNFVICSTGYWVIRRYDSNGGKGDQLAEGFVDQRTSYTMLATSQGDTQSLSLDGTIVATVPDTTLRTTDHIALTVSAGQQGTAETAVFSNFVFTPLPS